MCKQLLICLIVLAIFASPNTSWAVGPDARLQEEGVWYEGEFYSYDPAKMAQKHLQHCREMQENRRKRKAAKKEGVEQTEYLDEFEDDLEFDIEGEFDEEVLASFAECPEDCTCPECKPRPPLYARSEYLYGWTKGANLPPLATTSTAGTVQDEAGVLGLDSTTILFGDMESDQNGKSAGRFTMGMWLDQEYNKRLEFSYMFMGGNVDYYFRSSATDSILARPFLNVSNFEQDARLIAFPGLVEGTLYIETDSSFQSFEIHQRKRHNALDWGYIDFLIGYRANRLNDDLTIGEDTTSLSGATEGTNFILVDEFDAVSTFHGAQIGIGIQPHRRGRVTADCLLKFALGTTNMDAIINGTTTTIEPAADPNDDPTVTTENSGLYALDTNIGEYEDNVFSAVSEMQLTVNWEVRPSLVFSFGYSVMFWSDVMRAAEQVDLSINPTQIPPDTLVGLESPEFPNRISGYWIQALRIGLESRF